MNKPSVTLEGILHYQLVDDSGAVLQEGEQHNLITDLGLNQMALYGLFSFNLYACVGTGNTPPVASDQSLASEVGRSNTTASDNDTRTFIADGHYTVLRSIDFQQSEVNGNLTEWGFAPLSQSGISVRELFRDGQGNPVVITKTSASKLRLKYTLHVYITPAALVNVALTVAGLGDRAGYYFLPGLPFKYDLIFLDQLMRGQAREMWAFNDSLIRTWTRASVVSTHGSNVGNLGIVGAGAVPAYVTDSFARPGVPYVFDTGVGNGSIAGFGIQGPGPYYYDDFQFFHVLNPGQEIVKDELHRLTVTGPAVSWGRA